VAADVAVVVGGESVAARVPEAVNEGGTGHDVTYMADMESLMGIRLGILDHDPATGGFGACPIGATPDHFPDKASNEFCRIDEAVDVAVDGLDAVEGWFSP